MEELGTYYFGEYGSYTVIKDSKGVCGKFYNKKGEFQFYQPAQTLEEAKQKLYNRFIEDKEEALKQVRGLRKIILNLEKKGFNKIEKNQNLQLNSEKNK